MDDKTIIINETVTSRLSEVIPLNRPGSQFSTPLAGHLGWGVGAAIGTKLGAPEATVIAAEGDGSYMFAAPTACHFTAQKYRIPFLTVVYNNQAWNASINAARGLYPDGVAQKTRNFPGCDLSPSPQFELTAQACGAYAERVEEPDEVPRALQRALKAVKEERRPYQRDLQKSVGLVSPRVLSTPISTAERETFSCRKTLRLTDTLFIAPKRQARKEFSFFNRYGFNSTQLAASWRSQVFLRSVIPACF
jgi:hypothetical protein